MASHDIFVIGASAGGVEALTRLVGMLPPNLPASLFVVVHISPTANSALPQILSRTGSLPASHPQEREKIHLGRIYVAPPDRHMLIEGDTVLLSYGPRENSLRPAIDPLFRSAARSLGSRVTGMILSGTLGDGSAGLQAIKSAGGLAFVQDPQEALFSGMPLNTLQQVAVDGVRPLEGLAQEIISLAGSRPESGDTIMSSQQSEPDRFIQGDIADFEKGETSSARSVFTCPECGGVIWELREGPVLTYRCHVGHVYSIDSFLTEQASQLEAALWTAVRALEERASLLKRMSNMAEARGNAYLLRRLQGQSEEIEESASVIRRLLVDDGLPNISLYLKPTGDEPHSPTPPQS